MDYFPAFLRLHGKPVLLVGGGDIAARKARLLVASGAKLCIVAPDIVPALAVLVDNGSARYRRRSFRTADVEGHWLIVGATGDERVESKAAAAAERARIFFNSVDDLQNCSYITPAIVNRSPLIVAVSSSGQAPVLARQVRAQIEALLPARLGDVATLAGRWRGRVKEKIREFGQRLGFWAAFFSGDVADAVYRGRDDLAESRIESMLDGTAARKSGGMAWLVGAGPGDPDLLTLKALQVMQRADLILHDRLVSPEVLALARRDAESICVGKSPGSTANSQQEINALLVRLVAEGKFVCRLKGGDPFIFGRGGEEAEALDGAGLPYCVVPGITAAAGCAAAAGIPLTHRDAAQSLVLVTAHGKQSGDTLDWPSLARDRQTLAVYMGVRRFADLMNNLTRHGRSPDTPIAIIERGTTASQRVFRGTLGQLTLLAEAQGIHSPAMLIIGDVARLGASAPTDIDATTLPLYSDDELALRAG